MTNNLAKNRFFFRSIQRDLILDKMSIKQIILSCLRETITVYKDTKLITPDIDKILYSLSDKVILLRDQNVSSLVYSSAIAFPLGNIYNLSPCKVAKELADLLETHFQKDVTKNQLQCNIKVRGKGLIDFKFCDRYIGWWLENIIVRELEKETWRYPEIKNGIDRQQYNLFPLIYIHNRCSSLLLLGEREGLIAIKDHEITTQPWKIINSNIFQYYCDEQINHRYALAELNLLIQISLIFDYISDPSDKLNSKNTTKNWFQLLFDLGNTCLEFITACRIFGSVAQEKRNLAIARLGLISIVKSLLQKAIQRSLILKAK